MFDLLPNYAVELPEEKELQDWQLPIKPNIASQKDTIITSSEEAERMISTLEKISIGAIAFDTEFCFKDAGVSLNNGQTWHDPKTLQPLILSLAVWLPEKSKVLRYAIDLRLNGIASYIDDLFRLQVPFVAHYISAEMHTLWALGLNPAIPHVWDTSIASKAVDLGTRHKDGYSLIGLCNRYGIIHPFAVRKDILQASFLKHKRAEPFTADQFAYAIADADVTLQLYLAQQTDVIQSGLSQHLHNVEFPYAIANARMAWDGVPISWPTICQLGRGLDKAISYHKNFLNKVGLSNAQSPAQVIDFLQSRGLGQKIIRDGEPSSKDEVLEQIETLHPAITHIRRFRKYSSLRASPLFDGELIGQDGRLHPNHRHLAAQTGRSSCTAPNITGISKTFRPIVVAPKGRALIEFDYTQIEVYIAAAVHKDADLLKAANSGDVYAAMAQRFYAYELTEEERKLPVLEFKAVHPEMRDKMKVFVLGIIFGMSDHGLADAFGISFQEARKQQRNFFKCFPGISEAMKKAYQDGIVRGYAPIVGGLRRKIPYGAKAKNKHINSPIQGTAGVVYRKAVVDISKHFHETTTQLVLPIHDAVLIECDIANIEKVRGEVEILMRAAVRQYFPELNPKVEVNDIDLTCWNKDGKSNSIEKFVNDPSFKL